jgi:basic membrane protein A
MGAVRRQTMPPRPWTRAAALLALTLAALPACKKGAPPHTVGLALDVGGRGDQSFNDGALRGLEGMAAGLRYTPRGYETLPAAEYQKLIPSDLRAMPGGLPHLPIPAPIVLSGKAQEDYDPNLQLLVDRGVELVVGVGFMMEPATRAVAARNPTARFLLIDSPVLDNKGQPTTLPNVRAVVFREQEGSFLAGALAGELTRTGKIGFAGGMQLPLIKKFEAGFRAGVKTVNPAAAAQILVAYTGTFDDERKGVEVGQDLYARGCDIVFQAAGLDGLGVIKAAQRANRLVIGVDSDQAHVAPSNVLTSMVKHADLAVYEGARDVLQGKFSGGDVVLGLAEGGVGLAPLGGDVDPAITPQRKAEAMADVEKLRAAIVGKKLTVPATLDDVERFAPPSPASLGLQHAVSSQPAAVADQKKP